MDRGWGERRGPVEEEGVKMVDSWCKRVVIDMIVGVNVAFEGRRPLR